MKPTLALLVAPLAIACRPEFEQSDWLVTSARVLAVKGEPAETHAGQPVRFTPLIATPQTVSNTPTPTWRFCVAPKPPTEDNVVSTACLDSGALVSAGRGLSIAGV